MPGEDDRDLPLHDEAEARPGWRGGETFIDTGDGGSGPASEIDDAASGGERRDPVEEDLARRPPD